MVKNASKSCRLNMAIYLQKYVNIFQTLLAPHINSQTTCASLKPSWYWGGMPYILTGGIKREFDNDRIMFLNI